MTTRFTGAHARAIVAGTSLLALATACARKDAASSAAASTSAGSAAPATSTSTSTSAMTQAQKQDLHDAIRGYQLTDGNVDKVIAATQKMHALEKANPKLVEAMQREHGDAGDAKSVDDAAAHLDAIPPVKAILSSEGLSARDYVLTTFTLMEAGAAYQIQKAGKLPPNSELARDVSPENLAYIGAHQAQLRALEKATASGEEDE